MPDLTKIRTQWYQAIDDDEYEYLVGIVDHLQPALGPWLCLEDCAALVLILDLHDFRYADGFEISPGAGPDLGLAGAAQIAACFAEDPSVDYQAIKRLYHARVPFEATDPFYKRVDALMARILEDPTVTLLSGPYVPYYLPTLAT
jgi:hypothetical protein